MRTIIITLILILVPLTNIDYAVPNNELEQNVRYEIGTASNYTIETITPFSDTDRAQYVTFSNRTDGLDVVHYDSYLKIWHIRENTDGVWANTILPSQWSDSSRVHAFEYLSTNFGIFNVDIPNSKVAGNCPANQVIYNISVNNLSNSNLHTQFDFCAPGTSAALLLASSPASVGDDFFSFAFTTVEPMDILVKQYIKTT